MFKSPHTEQGAVKTRHKCKDCNLDVIEWRDRETATKGICPGCGLVTIDTTEDEPMCDECGWAQ